MDLSARIGWGIIIYAITYLAWGGMAVYGWTGGIQAYLVELLVFVVVCVWAGSQLRFHVWMDILPYSIGWAIIAAGFDAIYMVPVQGWSWYQQPGTWLTYALIALLPLLSILLRKKILPTGGSWES